MKILKRKGFTLIEVTIVIGLTGFLFVSIFLMYFQVQDILRKQTNLSSQIKSTLDTFKVLSTDLNNLVYEPWNVDQFFIVEKESINGENMSKLNFISSLLYVNPSLMQADTRSITYFVKYNVEKNISTLYRKEDIFVDYKHTERGIAIPYLDNILEFQILTSRNGRDWQDEWDNNKFRSFPRHIKVYLKWKENNKEREFSFIVRPPVLW